jgi:WD40 repeat protein
MLDRGDDAAFNAVALGPLLISTLLTLAGLQGGQAMKKFTWLMLTLLALGCGGSPEPQQSSNEDQPSRNPPAPADPLPRGNPSVAENRSDAQGASGNDNAASPANTSETPAPSNDPPPKAKEELTPDGAFISSMNVLIELNNTLGLIDDVESFRRLESDFDRIEANANQVVADGKAMEPLTELEHLQLMSKYTGSMTTIGRDHQQAMARFADDEELMGLVKGRVEKIYQILMTNPGPSPFHGLLKQMEAPKLKVVAGDGESIPLPGKLQAHESEVDTVVFSQDGSRFATGCLGTIPLKVWSSETGQLIAQVSGPDAHHGVNCVQFANGSRDLLFYLNSWIYHLSLEAMTVEGVVKSKWGEPGFAISHDGRYLVSGESEKLGVADIESKSMKKLKELPRTAEIPHAQFTDDDAHLMMVYMTGVSTSAIEFWNRPEERSLWSHDFDHKLLAAAISSDASQVFAVAQDDEGAKLISYDFATGAEQRRTVLADQKEGLRLSPDTYAWQFSPNANWLISVNPIRHTVRVYSTASGKQVAEFVREERGQFFDTGALSTASRLVVIGGNEGWVYCRRFEPPGAAQSGDGAAPAEAFRTWTTADGQYTVEAKLLKVTGDAVELEKKVDGKTIVVPLAKLSPADNEYVKSR